VQRRTGSWKYKGAHAEFTMSGTQAAGPPIATLAITGSVDYKR
jgi:hypothetical protein